MEQDRTLSNIKIQQLESRIDYLERQAKGTSVEIRNIPQLGRETKEDLLEIVLKTAQVLDNNIRSSEIKDVYRINTKANIKPIIADFTTVFTRDRFLSSIKKYNKENRAPKLNTACLGIAGQAIPVYVSENLTSRDRRLYFQAREFAKLNGYAFCWVSFARIFLRQEEGSTPIRIRCESDLANLKPN